MEAHTEIEGRMLLIDFYTHGGVLKGYRNSLGVPEEPDDELEIEVVSVIDEETGENLIGLVDSHEAELTEACYNSLQ